jgi:hypothetical protein
MKSGALQQSHFANIGFARLIYGYFRERPTVKRPIFRSESDSNPLNRDLFANGPECPDPVNDVLSQHVRDDTLFCKHHPLRHFEF